MNDGIAFRNALMQAVDRMPDGVLLLSGGIDSGCIAACLQRLGKTPQAIAIMQYGPEFVVDKKKRTKDPHIARTRARLWFPHSPVHVVTVTLKDFESSIEPVIRTATYCWKSVVEACATMEPVRLELFRLGYRHLIMGCRADDSWGLSLEYHYHYQRNGLKGWNDWRIHNHAAAVELYPPDHGVVHRMRAESLGMTLSDPYDDFDVVKTMMEFTHEDVTHPDKAVAYRAFPELKMCGCKKESLHNSVKDHLDSRAKALGYTSSKAWYNAVARKAGIQLRGSKEAEAAFEAAIDKDKAARYSKLWDELIERGLCHKTEDVIVEKPKPKKRKAP